MLGVSLGGGDIIWDVFHCWQEKQRSADWSGKKCGIRLWNNIEKNRQTNSVEKKLPSPAASNQHTLVGQHTLSEIKKWQEILSTSTHRVKEAYKYSAHVFALFRCKTGSFNRKYLLLMLIICISDIALNKPCLQKGENSFVTRNSSEMQIFKVNIKWYWYLDFRFVGEIQKRPILR